MRIVLTSPDGLTKTGVITTLREARRTFRTSFPVEPGAESVIAVSEATGIPARLSVETPPPPLAEFGERLAESDDERQPDGTWLQTWRVEPSLTLGQAKSQLAGLAIEIYWEKVEREAPTEAEVVAHLADTAAIKAARQSTYRPILNSVRQDIQGATRLAECFTIFKQLRDAQV